MYDIHSHLLPGIDDGAKTLEDSVRICRDAVADGVTTIVATPHIREGRWMNEKSGISARLEEVREELRRQDIPLEVVLGAEVYFAIGVFDAIQEGAYPTYADGRRYFLYELPNYFIVRQVQNTVFQFRTAGLTPVIAHPERNPQLMSNLDGLEELVRMGALLQVTAMSVTGRFGRSAKKAADLLLDRGMVHVIASDAHNGTSRPAGLSKARERLSRTYGEERAKALCVDNPRRIIAGEEVEGGINPPPPRGGLRGLLARLSAR